MNSYCFDPSALAAIDAAATGRAALWSLITAGSFFGARRIFLRFRSPLLHPGLMGIFGVVALLELTGHPYDDYWRETAWINWLLGPAVVAMAVPIYQLRALIRAHLRALVAVVSASLGIAIFSMVLMLALLGAPKPVIAAGTLKSITSPVAHALAVDAGASDPVAMAGVMLAGMLGASVGPSVLRWMRVRDERAIGLAMGCTCHGIGVGRAMEISQASGAYASLGMSGTAMLGAVVLPFVMRGILRW